MFGRDRWKALWDSKSELWLWLTGWHTTGNEKTTFHIHPGHIWWFTPLKFNIAPKNRQSHKETHLPTTIFKGRAVKFLVIYRNISPPKRKVANPVITSIFGLLGWDIQVQIRLSQIINPVVINLFKGFNQQPLFSLAIMTGQPDPLVRVFWKPWFFISP